MAGEIRDVGWDAGGDGGDTWDAMLEGRLEEGKDEWRDGKVHGDSDGIVSSWPKIGRGLEGDV